MKKRNATNEECIAEPEMQVQALLIAVSALQDTKHTPVYMMPVPPPQFIPIIGTVCNNDFISFDNLTYNDKEKPL